MAVQKTTLPKKDSIVKKFYLVDAEGKVLGRLAAKVAAILRGKTKPTFTPHMDTGDNVIIINAEKIRVTGKKTTDKFYDRYSGFHSGLKSIRYSDMLARRPHKILELAIQRMIPHGKLGARLKNKLYVYAGTAHPHQAQKPEVLDI
ncbi:MAG: 50S ribosomal protein L13 [Candidatus Omnitrophica bacterium]|nr:50S ribosomal protein L13 [Candidatus Omnitrophota bacterium]